MRTVSLALTIATLLGLVYLLAPGTSPAQQGRRSPAGVPAVRGLEVVNGSYSCYGSVYTDDQAPNLWAGAYLSATSGITSGFQGVSQGLLEAPADLDALAAVCETHVGEVAAQAPAICTLGPVRSDRGAFGNGESAGTNFDFSCQGTRDQVIDAIGGFSRAALTADFG